MIRPKGMVVSETTVPPSVSLDRFRMAIEAAGMRTFSQIDFQADAHEVGLKIDEAILLIFGNPKVGTLLVIDAPTCAIDLPLKALAWTTDGKHWLGYNDPTYIARRHGLSTTGPIQKMSAALKQAANALMSETQFKQSEEPT